MRLVGNLLITAFGLFILAITISFTASNGAMVNLGFWPFESVLTMPLWLVGLGGAGFGMVLGGLAMSLPLMVSRWQQKRLNRKLKVMEEKHAVKEVSANPMLPKP